MDAYAYDYNSAINWRPYVWIHPHSTIVIVNTSKTMIAMRLRLRPTNRAVDVMYGPDAIVKVNVNVNYYSEYDYHSDGLLP